MSMIICMFTRMNSKLKRTFSQLFRFIPAGLVFAIISSSFFHRCANVIPPTGGPRDTIPPTIVSSNPALYSTEVSPSVITINFDEYIEQRNLQQQFLISPPQEERPEIRQRGRVLTINLLSELAENTTYSLNFGNAIVDLNEGNPLRNFQFVFSTGSTIDSLAIEGKVVSALEMKPEENVTVMLYPNHHDSVPMKEIPLYVTRTDKEGYFRLRHLRADTFKLFALKDINNNYLYDRPGSEAIAFLDSLIFPTGFDYIKTQKTEVASLGGEHESEHDQGHNQGLIMQGATPVLASAESGAGNELLLRLFTEDITRQYITSATRPARNRLFITFNRTSVEEPLFSPLSFSENLSWKLVEFTPNKDSIIVWITDSLILQKDTIQMAVKFQASPSDTVSHIIDSLRFTFFEPRERVTPRGQQSGTASQLISFNARNGETVDLGKKITFLAASPVESIDTAKISLINIKDSIPVPLDFKISQHPLYPRRFQLAAFLEEDNEFRINCLPGAFKDIYGNISDSLALEFKTQKEINYGSLLLDLKKVSDYLILQLLDDKDNLISEHMISEDTRLEFKYLKPQRYKLRAIVDSNRNGKWDTGNYLVGVQPERVIMHADPIAVRAAWELEHTWEIPVN